MKSAPLPTIIEQSVDSTQLIPFFENLARFSLAVVATYLTT